MCSLCVNISNASAFFHVSNVNTLKKNVIGFGSGTLRETEHKSTDIWMGQVFTNTYMHIREVSSDIWIICI